MNISILIPNHSDLRMKELVESIDYRNDAFHSVQLVIVLNNPTPQLEELTLHIQQNYQNSFTFKIVHIDKCNLGAAYNAGIACADYEYILFLDSDLVCVPGAIQKMVDIMQVKKTPIVKGKVLFDSRSVTTRLTAHVRYVTTTDTKEPYIPVILMNKYLFRQLNDGYMFAVDTVWCSDADFSNRVMKKKIPITYIDAFFHHPFISLRKDIKDAFYYGLGKGIRTKRTGEKWRPVSEVRGILKAGKIRPLSLGEMIYLFLWSATMQIGCLIQLIFPNKMILKQSLDFEKSSKAV